MKKISTLIFIFLTSITFSQTQFSLYSGVSISNIDSEDFSHSNATGLGIGISSSTFLSKKSDLIVEFGYEYKSFSPTSYKNYDNNAVNLGSSNIGINNISITSLYNYYILTPKNSSFYLTAQGGLGTTVLNLWNTDDSELSTILEGTEHFKPFYVIGGSIGLENLRITVRYNKSLGNMLSGTFVQSAPDSSNSTDERYLNASISYFSINLTYLFNSQM